MNHQPVIVGRNYRHYKGTVYTVKEVCRLESDPYQMYVAYAKSTGTDDRVWLRPITEFSAEVEVNGTRVPRFMLLNLETEQHKLELLINAINDDEDTMGVGVEDTAEDIALAASRQITKYCNWTRQYILGKVADGDGSADDDAARSVIKDMVDYIRDDAATGAPDADHIYQRFKDLK